MLNKKAAAADLIKYKKITGNLFTKAIWNVKSSTFRISAGLSKRVTFCKDKGRIVLQNINKYSNEQKRIFSRVVNFQYVSFSTNFQLTEKK